MNDTQQREPYLWFLFCRKANVSLSPLSSLKPTFERSNWMYALSSTWMLKGLKSLSISYDNIFAQISKANNIFHLCRKCILNPSYFNLGFGDHFALSNVWHQWDRGLPSVWPNVWIKIAQLFPNADTKVAVFSFKNDVFQNTQYKSPNIWATFVRSFVVKKIKKNCPILSHWPPQLSGSIANTSSAVA